MSKVIEEAKEWIRWNSHTLDDALNESYEIIESLIKELGQYNTLISKRKILHDPQCERYTYLNKTCTCGLDEALSRLKEKR